MKTKNLILDKSFRFGIRIIKLFELMKQKRIERDLALQLLRSGTSIGANVEEAIGGSSRKDFIHKLEISYREARETKYWLRLFQECQLLETRLVTSFLSDCDEILRLLTAILKSSKQKQQIPTTNY